MKKEYKTDNELIAEFMGMTREIEYSHGVNHYEWVPRFEHSNWCFYDAPPFEKSWSWLMPVVEKMFNLWTGASDDKFQQSLNLRLHAFSRKCPIHSPIQQVYQRVVEFIKWYNSQAVLDGTKL